MQGTSIEITLWRGIADKFYDHIEEGQVRLLTEYTRLHLSYRNTASCPDLSQRLCVQDHKHTTLLQHLQGEQGCLSSNMTEQCSAARTGVLLPARRSETFAGQIQVSPQRLRHQHGHWVRLRDETSQHHRCCPFCVL